MDKYGCLPSTNWLNFATNPHLLLLPRPGSPRIGRRLILSRRSGLQEIGRTKTYCIYWGHMDYNIYQLPVVPARGGAEVALGIYIRPFSSIELACAVRQRSPCVHSSKVVSCFTCHIWSSTSHFALLTALFTLHTAHFTLHTSHFTLHSSQSTLHTPHFTLHTSQSTLHTSHFSLLSSHSTLHTALFTPHTSHCTLHTPHFISSELFSPYPSSSLLISSLLICHLSFHFIWFHVFPYVSYVLLGYFHVIWAQLKLSHALELLSTYLGASARQQGWA